MTPTSRYLTCAGRELHCLDWGQPQNPVVVAWHGLARTGRDMDELAMHLVGQGYRVICPDTVGRGLSQWAADPVQQYQLSFYAAQACDLLDQLGIERVHWVGTSMGGAIGTVCASGLLEPTLKPRIRSLVLNDNAPELAQAAIERIKAYAGQPPAFDTVRELETFFRQVYTPYGWLSDAQWKRLTESSVRRLPDGRVTPHYDPAPGHGAAVCAPPQRLPHLASLRRHHLPGAVPARRALRPRSARGGGRDAHARPRPAWLAAGSGGTWLRTCPCSECAQPLPVGDRVFARV